MKIHVLLASVCTVFFATCTIAQAGECTAKIDQLQKVFSKSDAGMGPTGNPNPAEPGAAQTGGQTGTPITEGTNNALQGKAASPSDVQQQNQGQQTAAEAAGGKLPMNTNAAHASLDRAKQLDKAGKEAECLDEVTKAKAAFGEQ
ncbi:hypothetical protein ACFPL7_00525 [Dongia soli]|uniref:Uncharacterized protein n=1 Tax=Dongia soli TaxID=600628 RepID=A0ABU5EEP5_9PROT|nr:hypothetical protein [Dongia soli]MDY0884407.1 hypothetical protein [Dongia soli]